MKVVKQEFQAAVEGDVAGRDITNEAPRTSIQIGAINGGQNIIGQTGDIHLQVQARPRIKVVIQPGPEHITDAQKVRLRDLVNEVVELETAIKRTPKRHATVWSALTGKLKVTSYHLIPASAFAQAEAYLQTWCARLRSAKSAPQERPRLAKQLLPLHPCRHEGDRTARRTAPAAG